MATLAPMPREMVRMTVAAKPGDLRNWRRASLRSYMGVWTGGKAECEQAKSRFLPTAGMTNLNQKQVPPYGRNDNLNQKQVPPYGRNDKTKSKQVPPYGRNDRLKLAS